LVEALVSSMNTRRSGSRSSWPSNQTSRAAATSGRSCSAAWAVFFDCDRPCLEEAPERSDASRNAAFLSQASLHFLQADVAGRLDQLQEEVCMSIEL
jgi:hypothetical protein